MRFASYCISHHRGQGRTGSRVQVVTLSGSENYIQNYFGAATSALWFEGQQSSFSGGLLVQKSTLSYEFWSLDLLSFCLSKYGIATAQPSIKPASRRFCIALSVDPKIDHSTEIARNKTDIPKKKPGMYFFVFCSKLFHFSLNVLG